MEQKITSKKFRTRTTHLTWLGGLVIAAVFFARCYDWTTINQPSVGSPNSAFDVSIVLKSAEGSDFKYDLQNKGCFGVLLPNDWGIKNDSFYYNVKGVLQNTLEPYEYSGYVVKDADYMQMYEDSVGSDADYYWWGGLSKHAHVDNLDSISITLTVTTDEKTGTFNLQYAMGTLDGTGTTPVAEGGLSPKVPITIAPANGIKNLKKEISVYPNPASDILNIDLGDVKNGNILLYNMNGKLSYEKKIDSKLNVINVSSFPSGTYLLKINAKDGSFNKKVIIR